MGPAQQSKKRKASGKSKASSKELDSQVANLNAKTLVESPEPTHIAAAETKLESIDTEESDQDIGIESSKENESNGESESEVGSDIGSDSEADSGSDSESFLRSKKKASTKKRNKTVELDEFMGGISSILNQEVPGTSARAPILSKNRQAELAIEEQKKHDLEKREKTKERRLALLKNHAIPDNSTIGYEKDLRKIATRGVVQLFNAVKTSQASSGLSKNNEKSAESLKKQEDLANMSKSSFLDLLKTSY